jgi:hypothetical protein
VRWLGGLGNSAMSDFRRPSGGGGESLRLRDTERLTSRLCERALGRRVESKERRDPCGSQRSNRPAGLCQRDLPRAPSLELYVLPIGGGQHSLWLEACRAWRSVSIPWS